MAEDIWAARCIVVHQGKVLLVDSGTVYPMYEPPYGEYEIPGGKIERRKLNETEEQAAIRELFEETGLKAVRVVKICEYDHTAYFFATEIANIGQERADLEADEILDVRWFRLEDLERARLERRTQVVLLTKETWRRIELRSEGKA